MSKKKAAKKNKEKKLNVVQEEEPVELTSGEKALEAVKPYASTIMLACIAAILGFFVVAFWMRANFDSKAIEWRELSSSATVAINTGDISSLREVSETYPTTPAGMWAAQIAGDIQLRRGLQQLANDRENGLSMIKKAKELFQQIKEAPANNKSTMLQRRSQFALAYAHESLGELNEAKTLYDELVEAAPDSAFAKLAQRGSARAGSEDFAKLYERFVSWEDEMGEAPGVPVPQRPSIEFPDVDLPAGDAPKDNPDMIDPKKEAEKKAAAEAEAKKAAEEKAKAEAEAAEKAKAEAEAKMKAEAEAKKKAVFGKCKIQLGFTF